MTTSKPSEPKVVYPTYGVHNPPKYSPCACSDCLYQRGPGEPSDPLYPEYWTAKWTMYRVFNKYVEFPPPYDGPPPSALKAGVDYQVSYGTSYYDSTWRGPNGEEGAMMEYYDEWSLPIFPMDNHFSSSFVSLGDKAYFITYDKDRPKGMPPICQFSDLNHPPHRDFIKHLPYSKGDSERLCKRIQGYSFWTNPDPTKPADYKFVPGHIKIRHRFLDFTGKYVLHCHILGHEDRGMMQLIEVVPNKTTIKHH